MTNMASAQYPIRRLGFVGGSIRTTLTCIARELLRTPESIATPCSVKANGRDRRHPPQPLEITICDFKFALSSAVNRNMKSPAQYPIRRRGIFGGSISARRASNTTLNCRSYFPSISSSRRRSSLWVASTSRILTNARTT